MKASDCRGVQCPMFVFPVSDLVSRVPVISTALPYPTPHVKMSLTASEKPWNPLPGKNVDSVLPCWVLGLRRESFSLLWHRAILEQTGCTSPARMCWNMRMAHKYFYLLMEETGKWVLLLLRSLYSSSWWVKGPPMLADIWPTWRQYQVVIRSCWVKISYLSQY